MERRISVIIPCYCASKWLQQCYLSLINQTIGMDHMELIFVDDASNDNGKTWNMLLNYEQEFPENIIILHLEKNKRQGGARNAGLSYASGEYIAFCDADDWLDKTALQTVYSYAKKTDADIVQFGQYYYVDQHNIQQYTKNDADSLIEIHTIEERRQFINSQIMTIGFSNKLYRRSFLIQSGVHFAENAVYEEPLFTYPLLYMVNRFARMKESLYYYRYNTHGTMLQDMNDMRTLTDHANVQMQVYDFMLKLPCFTTFKDEINLYFLHTCLYETISFAKLRNFPGAYTIFKHLGNIIRNHYPYLGDNRYLQSGDCSKQRQILELALADANEEEFNEFYKNA